MKPRKVVVTIEVETDETISNLKRKDLWEHDRDCSTKATFFEITQIQVNVVKEEKE